MIVDTKKLSTLLIQFRNDRNYKQSYMATQIGISQKSYSYLESGRCKMDLIRFLRIAEVFEVDPMIIISKIINNDHPWSICKEVETYEDQILKLNKHISYLKSHNDILKETISKLIDHENNDFKS